MKTIFGFYSKFRIVWRLAKHRKSGTISTKPKCQIINQYFEKIVSLFLCDNYLLKARIVHISVDKLHHLAKVFLKLNFIAFFRFLHYHII